MHPELTNYLERIQDLRRQVRAIIVDLPAEALNWRPFENREDHETNSLAVLATHIAGAEHFWIAEVIGGRPATRDRDAEFDTQTTDSAELDQLLEETGLETNEIFSALSLDDLEGVRTARGRTIPMRWCITHVIDHTALHLGHMQITYQLWTGGQSKPSPLWFERLSSRRNHL